MAKKQSPGVSEDERSLYPLEAGHSGDDTSKSAAKAVDPKAEVLRRKALATVRKAPTHLPGYLRPDKSPDPKITSPVDSTGRAIGITSYEASQALGEPHHNIHPRFSELRAAGLIRDSGVRRVNDYSGRPAIAWVAGADPSVRADGTNAPPKQPKQREAYIKGMTAAYYTVHGVDPESTFLSAAETIKRRLAQLEPGNPDWQY